MASDPPVCKHCGERIGPPIRQLHLTGRQVGKYTCALEPYGYMAERIGQPCDPRACIGARAVTPDGK
jgi:hypothetical protein